MSENSRALNILVVTTKGGAGKSLISQNVLATYNLSRFGHAELVELDDENLDSAYLNRSAIEPLQVKLGDDPDLYAEAVVQAVSLDSSGRIIDVGGNRTASIVIQELSRLSRRMKMIDAICIPVSDNRVTVDNARKTLEHIAKTTSGKSMLNRCFLALNRVRNKKADSLDSPGMKRRYDNFAAMAKEWGLPVLLINDMDGVENLAPLGQTIPEIASKRSELVSQLDDLIDSAHSEGREDDMVRYDNLQWSINVAADDYMPLLEKAHERLDSVLAEIERKVASESKQSEVA